MGVVPECFEAPSRRQIVDTASPIIVPSGTGGSQGQLSLPRSRNEPWRNGLRNGGPRQPTRRRTCPPQPLRSVGRLSQHMARRMDGPPIRNPTPLYGPVSRRPPPPMPAVENFSATTKPCETSCSLVCEACTTALGRVRDATIATRRPKSAGPGPSSAQRSERGTWNARARASAVRHDPRRRHLGRTSRRPHIRGRATERSHFEPDVPGGGGGACGSPVLLRHAWT